MANSSGRPGVMMSGDALIEVQWPNHSLSSCRPNSLDSLRQTDVCRLKLVQTNADQDSCGIQAVPKQLAGLRQPLLGDVVDDDGLETHV